MIIKNSQAEWEKEMVGWVLRVMTSSSLSHRLRASHGQHHHYFMYHMLASLTYESGASSEYHFIKVTIDVLPYHTDSSLSVLDYEWASKVVASFSLRRGFPLGRIRRIKRALAGGGKFLSHSKCEFNHVLDTQQMYCLRIKISRLLC